MDNEIGFFRLPQVLEMIPISKSLFWARCKTGEYPAPVHLSARVTAWKKSDIYTLVEKLGGEKNDG